MIYNPNLKLRNTEKLFHCHIINGYDFKEKSFYYVVYTYSWKKAFKATNLDSLLRGLKIFKKRLDDDYKCLGFDYEF